jgi:hypothetical protein
MPANELHELIPLLVQCCPGFREPLVRNADDWIREDGTFGFCFLTARHADYVVEQFDQGEYGFADELFSLVERLLEQGTEAVKAAIATGFLEQMQDQQELPSPLWAPLVGKRARDYLAARDTFHGTKTPGLN